MKKSSLMGASVVAAALLAAAPVVAPVASLAASGTQQVVKAADYSGNMAEVAKKVKDMSTVTTVYNNGDASVQGSSLNFIYNLQSIPKVLELASKPAKLDINKTAPLYIADNAIKVSDQIEAGWHLPGNDSTTAKTDALLKYFFNGENQVALATAENTAAAKNMSYTISFKYSSAIGNNSYYITNKNDVYNVRHDLTTNGGSVTMYLQLFDGNGKSMNDAGLMQSTVKYNVANQKAAYVDYTDTLNAHVGDSANIYGLSNSFVNANGVIRNYNGEDITDLAYKAGAITVSQLLDINGHVAAAKADIVNGNFAKTGQYYQNVVINLSKAGVNVPGNDWEAAAKGGLISVNGQMPSITNADAKVYLVTAKDTIVNGQKYQPGQLILKRTVNVDVNQGAFKTDKINGKVTVNMNDGMAAQVYDENGKQVLGRALPNKSAWKTIEKRTYYKDGQVFYQVSTNEYVKAQDVVFTEYSSSSNDNDPLSGKVNVTKYPSKVINILNDGYAAGVYAINEDGQGMHQVIGRFLPSGSAWINQGTAEVNGNLFYQVSTNEWVSANSVVK